MKRAATRRAEERVSITPIGLALLTQHLERKAQRKQRRFMQRLRRIGRG